MGQPQTYLQLRELSVQSVIGQVGAGGQQRVWLARGEGVEAQRDLHREE